MEDEQEMRDAEEEASSPFDGVMTRRREGTLTIISQIIHLKGLDRQKESVIPGKCGISFRQEKDSRGL